MDQKKSSKSRFSTRFESTYKFVLSDSEHIMHTYQIFNTIRDANFGNCENLRWATFCDKSNIYKQFFELSWNLRNELISIVRPDSVEVEYG